MLNVLLQTEYYLDIIHYFKIHITMYKVKKRLRGKWFVITDNR